MYSIVPRGKDESLIKTVSNVPGKHGKGFRLHFPCLSVHIIKNNDKYEENYWNITWSNYHPRNKPDQAQFSPEPGEFKIKRVSIIPEIILERDNNGRVVTYKAPKTGITVSMINYLEMGKWGSYFDPKEGWSFGKNHPMERVEVEFGSYSTIDQVERAMEKFGETGQEALCLFVGHPLYEKFVWMPAMAA